MTRRRGSLRATDNRLIFRLAAAAAIGIPLGGSPEERNLNDAINCGFSAPGKGTVLLADAESTGDGVKLQAA